MTSAKIVARTMLHSAYVPKTVGDGDALVISEIVERDNNEITPEIRVIKNPEVQFWITKPEFRFHTDKKEFEDVKKLDCIRVPYKFREREMFRILNGYTPNFMSRQQRSSVLESPYVYGGNISLGAFAAMKYKDDLRKANRINHQGTTGFLDIEQSLLPDSLGKMPIVTYTCGNRVFVAIKDSFMYEPHDGKFIRITVDDIKEVVTKYIDPMVIQLFEDNKKEIGRYKDQLPFQYEYFVCDTEIEMIRWIFDRIHETKVSFMGVWNLNFDIPQIINFIKEAGVRLEDIFVHPSLRDTPFGFIRYKEDKKEVAHFTQKWHWLTCTAHFQFVDAMSLYSFVRTVDGKEASYQLDDILRKYNLGGKLKVPECKDLEHLQTADWHRAMLSTRMRYYVAYGIWDTMSLQILEWRNNDMTSMVLGADITPVETYPRQTVKATNVLFDSWKKKGFILGTGVNVEGIADEDLLNGGGAVLEPRNLVASGVPLFKDWPTHFTKCFFWGNDLDFSAQYPTNTIVANISKQTKVATVISVVADHVQQRYTPDEAVEVMCSYLITPNANGANMGVEFLGLPNFEEIDDIYALARAA